MRKKEGFEYSVLVAAILLVAVGIVAVYSATYYKLELRKTTQSEQSVVRDSDSDLIKQLEGAGLGIAVMVACIFIPKKFWTNRAVLAAMALVSVALLVAVLIMGESKGGAKRWIQVLGVSFQPSEVARLSIVFLYAYWFDKYDLRAREPKKFMMAVLPPLGYLVVIAGLVLAGNNLSMTISIVMLALIMMVIAGMRWQIVALMSAGAGIMGFFAVKLKEFRMDRIVSFLDPFKYKGAGTGDEGYQLCQALYAIGAGGVFGRGVGNSKQKLNFLTQIDSDFIYAFLAEEIGLIGVILVLGVYWVLIARSARVASLSRDTHDLLLAAGFTSMIAVQVLIHVGVTTASMPTTGLPLPFISSGNTSLIMYMAAVGIILSISRRRREA